MNLAEFHFIRPYWLIALIPFLAIIAAMLRNKLARGNWSDVCDAALLPYLLQDQAVRRSRWPLMAGTLAAMLAILALAGPTWARLPAPVFRNDAALVIALDLSTSMLAEDIKPSRLIRARYKIADILKQRKDGQTALLVYAGDAFVVTPLTNDTETIASQLEALTPEIMPAQGNDTAAALKKAADLFKQAGLQKGRIILVTDSADPDKTLDSVKALEDYSLSILGVGTPDGAPIALPESGFLKDHQGTIVVAQLDEAGLKTLAQAGGGIYQAITANDADIQALLANLDHPITQSGRENPNLLLDQWSDLGPWLLLPVLPLAALMFRKGLLCLALMLVFPFPQNSHAFGWRDLWQTKDQQARQAYQQQQYDKAAQLFDNPDWKAAAQYKAGNFQQAIENLKNSAAADSPYNRGNALAQAGQLEEALKAYRQALDIKPGDEDAKYNKELIEKELEKQKQQQKSQNRQQGQDQDQQKSQSDKNRQDHRSEPADSPQQAERNEGEQSSAEQQQPPEPQEQPGKPDDTQQADARQAQAQDRKEDASSNPQPTDFNHGPKTEPIPAQQQPTAETQQANEQWLKRIPDDPAGLLKRKFRYQYSQRQHPANSEADGW